MGKQDRTPKTKVYSEDETIADILHDLRGNRLAVINLVKKLEGAAFNEETHGIEFCRSYTVKLIQNYCKDASVDGLKDYRGTAKGSAEDRAELMLAACGLLRGFEFDSSSIGDRMEAYCNYARGYNSSIKGNWGKNSLGTIYRTQLHFIEMELHADLKKSKDKNGGKLGLMSQVSADQPLPVPRGDITVEPEPDPPIDDKFCIRAIFSKIVSKLPRIKYETKITLLLLVIAISTTVIAITSVISLMSRDAPPIDSPASISELSPSPTQSSAADGVGDSFSNSDTADVQN